jgi:hypothetical protein
MSALDPTGPDGGNWEPAQSVHPAGRKRVHPEDDETTEEEFGGQPEDDDTTEDGFLGAQPEDARQTEWEQSRPGSLARLFELAIPFRYHDSPRPMQSLADSAFGNAIATAHIGKAHMGKTTKKSAKGAKEKTKNAVFRALVQDMHPLPPDCLVVPLVRSRSCTTWH